jgi:hypothetical protein
MTRDRFRAAMVRLGYSTAMVSFDGPGIGECYVIEHSRRGWSVYYSERGQRREERSFDSETYALRYLLGWIVADNP